MKKMMMMTMKFVSLLMLVATVVAGDSETTTTTKNSSSYVLKKDSKGFPLNPKDSAEGESVRDAILGQSDCSAFVKALNMTSNPNYLDMLGNRLTNWTIFVPVNQAWDRLSQSELTILKNDDWQGHRDRLLGYHIVNGLVEADAFAAKQTIRSLFGFELMLSLQDGKKVIDTEEYTPHAQEESTTKEKEHYQILQEIPTGNGKIYIINKVIHFHMTRETIYSLGSRCPDFTNLMTMTERAGVTGYSTGPGPNTIMAPTNEALGGVGLTNATFDADLFRSIFQYHIVPGRNLYAGSAAMNSTIPTALPGSQITITPEGIDNSNVISKDILLSNGIVHIVDRLLLPQSMLTMTGNEPNWHSIAPQNGMKWRLVQNRFHHWCSTVGNTTEWVPLENKHTRCLETNTASGYGDPHIKTWSGAQYDFHGGCDLILLQNPDFRNGLGLNVHVRTTIHTWWSSISAAAVQIGSDILEITGSHDKTIKFWINGGGEKELTTGEASLGDFAVSFRRVNDHQSQTRIDLGNRGDAISIETYNHFVRVNLKDAKKTSFTGSLGLLGAYPNGAKIGRDGTTVFEDNNEFGQEWMVKPVDKLLFHDVASAADLPLTCPMPEDNKETLSSRRRRLGESAIAEEDAAIACARVTDSLEFDACVHDVLATNDKDIAGSY